MKTLFRKLLLDHWQRKCISLFLASMIWLVIDHSLTTTRTLGNIPIKVINIPTGKTVEGMQVGGHMAKRISVTLSGSKTLLDSLSPNDLEVVIDARGKPDQWVASLAKTNLVSLNPEIDLSKGISKISNQSFPIRMTRMITDKIPILITQPIGEAPRGYQFLDVYPYQLMLTVSGPEEMVKRLKAKGPKKLTFNLNDISKAQLDSIQTPTAGSEKEEISFYIPEAWKQIALPTFSDIPLEIDDANAKNLRIDFVRHSLLALPIALPVTLFFTPEFRSQYPERVLQIAESGIVQKTGILSTLSVPLYVKGVGRLFLEIVQNMIQLVVVVSPKSEEQLEWSIQFINAPHLEDRYVAARMADGQGLEPSNLREEYLRNRFRSYMNHFQLYISNNSKLKLKASLTDTALSLTTPDPD